MSEIDGWKLASAVMTIATGAAGILGLLVAIFAPQIVHYFLLPGRDEATQLLTANMTRLMMITPFIFSMSGLVMGILQSQGIFLLPSIALSMNNIGIMVGALVIAPALPSASGVAQIGNANIYGLAYGAILSAILHLAVQLPGLVRIKARLRLSLNWRLDGVSTILKLMGPRVLGLAVVQINFMVNINLASDMIKGSLVALNTAFMLMFFALGVIGQSIGSAVFPTLSALYATRDWKGYQNRLANAIRNVLFLAIPATVCFIVLGEPIVSIFEHGQWTHESTQATAWALAFYAIGIVGFALLEVLSRAFYALADTWTPVLVGMGAMTSNIILSLILVHFIGIEGSLIHGRFGGLALANASTTLVEAVILWWLLRQRIKRDGTLIPGYDRHILANMGRVIIAAAVMGVVMGLLRQVLTIDSQWVAIVGLIVGGGVFFMMALLLRIEEATQIPMIILRRFQSS